MGGVDGPTRENGSVTRNWSFLSISGHYFLPVGLNGNKSGTKAHSSSSPKTVKAIEAK